MTKETWAKIVGGIAVTILPDARGGMMLQAKGPVTAVYSAQTAVQRTVPADKLEGLQLPETYLETLIERMVRQVETAMAADERDGDVPV